jgi:hypothetical protein
MQPLNGQVLDLIDAGGRLIGRITVERSEGGLLYGEFAPGPGFPAVERLFRDWEAAVDSQALAVVDQLDAAITGLGLQLRSGDGAQSGLIQDVQIWSDGGITCRLGGAAPATVNGDPGLSKPTQPVRE